MQYVTVQPCLKTFLYTHSSYNEALKTFTGFKSKGLNTQDTAVVFTQGTEQS